MNIVIKVNEETKQKMIEYYKDKVRDKKIPYAIFQAQEEDTVITLYESGKAMFQGTSADVDAAMWGTVLDNTKEKKEEQKKKDAKYGDSKKITDEKIKKITPELIKIVKYRSMILTNQEYNEKYTKDINMNKIKAILHNKVLYQLMTEEKPEVDYIVVDEFARENRYYEYLNGVPNIQRNITFMTKAEDKNLAVAAASIISRYIFLKEFDKLSDSIHIPLPKGAGRDVDEIGEEIVEKYGEEKLKDIAKVNFKNTDRILHTMIF